MKYLSKLIMVAIALILVSGCSFVREFNTGRHNENTKSGVTWLSDHMEPAGINIAGHWRSDDWGDAKFTQSGRDVGGRLGDYDVRGVVSGQRAYLLLSEGGWNYYRAVLETPVPGVLSGHFTRSVPYIKNLERPMRLEQLAH